MDLFWRILSVVGTVGFMIVGALLKSYLDMNSRVLVAETKIETQEKTIECIREDLKSALKQIEERQFDAERRLEGKFDAMLERMNGVIRLEEQVADLARTVSNVNATMVTKDQWEAFKEILTTRVGALERNI